MCHLMVPWLLDKRRKSSSSLDLLHMPSIPCGVLIFVETSHRMRRSIAKGWFVMPLPFLFKGGAPLGIKGHFLSDVSIRNMGSYHAPPQFMQKGFIVADLGGGTLDFSTYKAVSKGSEPMRLTETTIPTSMWSEYGRFLEILISLSSVGRLRYCNSICYQIFNR